jgi:hypothetical protein
MTPRPSSLKDVAEQSDSNEAFGRNLRDWLHEVRRFSSRAELDRALKDEPQSLKDRFPRGDVADAWLGAYAEHTASRIGRPPPEWAFQPFRTAAEPWFAEKFSNAWLRGHALRHSPLAFKRRNIYTASVDLPLRLRAGRPKKSAAQKRETNAERQRRFRERRREELTRLRKLTPA